MRLGWVATRMSPAPAYGRALLLDFAAPPTPTSSAVEAVVGSQKSNILNGSLAQTGPGQWGTQRSGIKEESEGRGTAAKLSAPLACSDVDTAPPLGLYRDQARLPWHVLNDFPGSPLCVKQVLMEADITTIAVAALELAAKPPVLCLPLPSAVKTTARVDKKVASALELQPP